MHGVGVGETTHAPSVSYSHGRCRKVNQKGPEKREKQRKQSASVFFCLPPFHGEAATEYFVKLDGQSAKPPCEKRLFFSTFPMSVPSLSW